PIRKAPADRLAKSASRSGLAISPISTGHSAAVSAARRQRHASARCASRNILGYIGPSLPATNAERLRKGAKAPKQSSLSSVKILDCFAEPVNGRKFEDQPMSFMTSATTRINI